MDSITYNNNDNSSAFAAPQKRKQEQRDDEFLYFTPSSSSYTVNYVKNANDDDDSERDSDSDSENGDQKMTTSMSMDGWHSPSSLLSSNTWPLSCAESPPKKLKMIGTSVSSSFAPLLKPRFSKFKQQDVASIFRPKAVAPSAPTNAIIDLFATAKNEKEEQDVLSFLAFPSLPSGPTEASKQSYNSSASKFVLSPRTTLAPRCFSFVPIPDLWEGKSLFDNNDEDEEEEEDIEEESFDYTSCSDNDDEQQLPYLSMEDDDDDDDDDDIQREHGHHSYSIEPTMNSHEILFPSLLMRKRPTISPRQHQFNNKNNQKIAELSLPTLAEVPTANAQDPSLELPFPAVAA